MSDYLIEGDQVITQDGRSGVIIDNTSYNGHVIYKVLIGDSVEMFKRRGLVKKDIPTEESIKKGDIVYLKCKVDVVNENKTFCLDAYTDMDVNSYEELRDIDDRQIRFKRSVFLTEEQLKEIL